jgi:hypothetical protein
MRDNHFMRIFFLLLFSSISLMGSSSQLALQSVPPTAFETVVNLGRSAISGIKNDPKPFVVFGGLLATAYERRVLGPVITGLPVYKAISTSFFSQNTDFVAGRLLAHGLKDRRFFIPYSLKNVALVSFAGYQGLPILPPPPLSDQGTVSMHIFNQGVANFCRTEINNWYLNVLRMAAPILFERATQDAFYSCLGGQFPKVASWLVMGGWSTEKAKTCARDLKNSVLLAQADFVGYKLASKYVRHKTPGLPLLFFHTALMSSYFFLVQGLVEKCSKKIKAIKNKLKLTFIHDDLVASALELAYFVSLNGAFFILFNKYFDQQPLTTQ